MRLTRRFIALHWRAFTVLLGVAAFWLVRGWILQGLACGLIVNEEDADAACVWVAGGDHCYDRAAQLYRERPSREILLVEEHPCRLVRAGVQPSRDAISRRELGLRGVPSGAVIVIPGKAQNAWEEAQLLEPWLQSRPNAGVLLLCDRFRSRRLHVILNSVLGADDARRVHILALPDRRFDETNWWQNRDGIKHVGFSYLELLYTWCRGRPDEPPETWDADDYEWTLRQTLAGATE